MSPAFAVAVKSAIFDSDRLLVLKKSVDEQSQSIESEVVFDLPGGRIEFGEEPIDALVREVREETSLETKIGCPLRAWSVVNIEKGLRLVGITFHCRAKSIEVVCSSEHSEAHWMTFDEVQESGFDADDRFAFLFNWHNERQSGNSSSSE